MGMLQMGDGVQNSADILNISGRSKLETDTMSSKTSTSSAAANTSSSSIKSAAQYEQNGLNNSTVGAATMLASMRDTISLRHQNKHLSEVNVKISELESPAMSTRDRVMNWMVADEFSDLEDDIDLDDGKCISAFRSERVNWLTHILLVYI